jgi:3-hydroxybutyryl-CoA dehydratase
MHGYYFEDLEVGMSASSGKTLTEADIVLFSAVSGDINPSHLNEEFARGTRLKTRVAHGMLTASLISGVLGCQLPGPGCIYLSQSTKFLAPVKPGETVMATVSVAQMEPDRNFVEFDTRCTVGDTRVIEGRSLLWVPPRPA